MHEKNVASMFANINKLRCAMVKRSQPKFSCAVTSPLNGKQRSFLYTYLLWETLQETKLTVLVDRYLRSLNTRANHVEYRFCLSMVSFS